MGVRPPLPYKFANPYIKEHTGAQLPPVKYQILSCQGKDILVGRLKIDTPTEAGHAFVLRRYDTGAVSLTTMFRVAFPNASEFDEKAEIQWVKDNFDLSGNNGGSKDPHIIRLAGTWVDPQLALELSKAYSLSSLVKMVVDASPDPNGTYRRSGKNAASQQPAPSVVAFPLAATTSSTLVTNTAQTSTIVVSKSPSATKTLLTPSPTSNPPPAKRRKEASPAPSLAATCSIKPPSRTSPPPVSKTTTAAPRRSTRKSKSPAPRTMMPVRTPKRSTKKDQANTTPSSSELAAVDEEGPVVENGVAGTELMEEDIEEQKRLIAELKQKEEVASPPKTVDDKAMEESEPASKKREHEDKDQPLTFDFKEPEIEERPIATNRRIIQLNLEPRTKSFAWGVAAFAVGMGAMAFLPNLF